MESEKKTFTVQFGEYLIDVSKLTFGGVVLSMILEVSQNKILVLLLGALATFGVAVWGFILISVHT